MHSLSAVTRLFISIKRSPGIYVQAIRAMMCLLDKVGCFMMILFLLLLSFVQTVICKKCRFVFLQLLKTKKSMQFRTSIFILNYIIRTTHQPLPTPCRGLVVDQTGDANNSNNNRYLFFCIVPLLAINDTVATAYG